MSNNPQTTKDTLGARGRRIYRPTRNGIHICGITYENDPAGEFQTVENFPCRKPDRAAYDIEQFAIPHHIADLVVDVVIGGDIVRDFSIRRQDIAAIKRLLIKEGHIDAN